MNEKTPREIFYKATETLWSEDNVEFGYFTPANGVWHLSDGRNFKVTFQEVTVSNI